MKTHTIRMACAMLVLLVSAAAAVQIGKTAPEFALRDTQGHVHQPPNPEVRNTASRRITPKWANRYHSERRKNFFSTL